MTFDNFKARRGVVSNKKKKKRCEVPEGLLGGLSTIYNGERSRTKQENRTKRRG